jgi:hypothetical protein
MRADEKALRLLRLCYRVPLDAFYRFNADDGWAIASHIALSTLMSLFPFLILCTALAGFFGSKDLADEVGRILLEAWPTQVATPIAAEIHNVLTALKRLALPEKCPNLGARGFERSVEWPFARPLRSSICPSARAPNPKRRLE